MDIYYIDRKTGEKKKEIIASESYLRWNNETKTGKWLLERIVKRKLFSYIYGKLQDCSLSKRKIRKFIENLEVDMSEAETEDASQFNSFNDFFTRKLKKEVRPIDLNSYVLISPADGKILAYEDIDIQKIIQIKGLHYSLKELIENDSLANEFAYGTCLIIRLAPSDYHRFHFPDSGIPREAKKIKGYYYSVNPIALNNIDKLFCQNKREVTMFDSDNFGKMVFVEVGATCVGSIIQTYNPYNRVTKGEEKGYFKFGGSTVIVFIQKGYVTIDKDIIKNTLAGFETKVYMGEAIGKSIK